jgi:hypothetical protein
MGKLNPLSKKAQANSIQFIVELRGNKYLCAQGPLFLKFVELKRKDLEFFPFYLCIS